MKHFLLFITTSIVAATPLLALADDFNYPDPISCQTKVAGSQADSYLSKAQALALQYTPHSEEWTHYMNMATFFNNFANASLFTTTCDDKECVTKADSGCDIAYHTDAEPWTTMVEPTLRKEANYINQGQYDPTLSNGTIFTVVCTYKLDGQHDFDKCVINQHT